MAVADETDVEEFWIVLDGVDDTEELRLEVNLLLVAEEDFPGFGVVF
jgi:hypothetical protein